MEKFFISLSIAKDSVKVVWFDNDDCLYHRKDFDNIDDALEFQKSQISKHEIR